MQNFVRIGQAVWKLRRDHYRIFVFCCNLSVPLFRIVAYCRRMNGRMTKIFGGKVKSHTVDIVSKFYHSIPKNIEVTAFLGLLEVFGLKQKEDLVQVGLTSVGNA